MSVLNIFMQIHLQSFRRSLLGPEETTGPNKRGEREAEQNKREEVENFNKTKRKELFVNETQF